MNPDHIQATAATARTPKSLVDELFKEAPGPQSFSYSPQTTWAVISMPKFLTIVVTLLVLTLPMAIPAMGFGPPPTGIIVSAVLNDASSLTVTLSADAHDPGVVCAPVTHLNQGKALENSGCRRQEHTR